MSPTPPSSKFGFIKSMILSKFYNPENSMDLAVEISTTAK
jgi:hypothetical protein